MNSRELAAVIWFGVLVAWALSRRDTREAIGGVVAAALNLRLLLPMLAMAAYVCALIAYAGSPLGLWDATLVADVVAWAIATGLLLFGSATTLFNRPVPFAGSCSRRSA